MSIKFEVPENRDDLIRPPFRLPHAGVTHRRWYKSVCLISNYAKSHDWPEMLARLQNEFPHVVASAECVCQLQALWQHERMVVAKAYERRGYEF